MRFITSASVLLCSVILLGCYKSISIKYVIPTGFRGVFKLVGNDPNGLRIQREFDTLVLEVPESGELRIARSLPTREWHRSSAFYSDGKMLAVPGPANLVKPETIALRMLGTMDSNEDWFVVGTLEDVRALLEQFARERMNRASKE